jgi:ribonuclease D
LATRSLLDLQYVLTQDGASLPGLKACAARYSLIPLSKEQQCSNWAHRPLSQVQLDYAGLDAAILPVLLAEYVKQNKETNKIDVLVNGAS